MSEQTLYAEFDGGNERVLIRREDGRVVNCYYSSDIEDMCMRNHEACKLGDSPLDGFEED